MSAVEALKTGDLAAALAALQDEVRAAPDEARHRVFLFQLLSVLGEWDRAQTQLDVIRELDKSALPMVQTYRQVLRCAAIRRQVFNGECTPLVLGEPPSWIAQIIESLRLSVNGNRHAAIQLREQAFEQAPATAGRIWLAGDDQERSLDFDWIADADMRLGPILEAIVNGIYYWVPFQRIARIEIEPPTDLRDRVWSPAHFRWTNAGDAVGMIPTRYPGSELHDSQIQLARKTEWREPIEGVFEGVGQRVLATNVGEFALMDVRRIELNPST